MRCLFCGKDTKVVDKRDGDEITRRRRECLSCGKRFTTHERAHINLMVIKKDGSREKFDRQKLVMGLLKAFEKRPVSQESIENLANEVETELRSHGEEILSKDVGEITMNKLKILDKIAYVRFASVYRNFDDLVEFENELKVLKSKS